VAQREYDPDDYEMLTWLLSGPELQAIADHWEKESWVWERMVKHDEGRGVDSTDSRKVYDHAQARLRLMKTLTAREEQEQSEWEARHGVPCPHCGATSNQMCTTAAGHPLKDGAVHKMRERAAGVS
jgi:hypothetical protein